MQKAINLALYRFKVKRVMCWEYGAVGTRTDWRF
jgi:hypothetical protein